ncbi:hypothetical protein SO802_015455 [Lithocarpus litseifolius]|uniref:Uncharacterized protein n=1 Tax=Lithocarpus litseifolius TaxID=425828 RepID=A0AAW2CW40_9ROSI
MIKAIHLLELGMELKASVTEAACYDVRDLVIVMVGDSDGSYGGRLIVWLGHGWERERRKLGRKLLLEDLAGISLDLKTSLKNAPYLGSVGFLRIWRRKPANRPAVYGFWRRRPAANRHWRWVGRFSCRIGWILRVGRATVLFG